MTEAIATTDDLQPWDRMPKEPAKGFNAFTVFRDLGYGRSLEKTRQKLGAKAGYKRQLEDWSVKWGWVERAVAWDLHEDRRKRERMEERKIAMELRQEEIGRMGMEAIAARLFGGEITLKDGSTVQIDAIDWSNLSQTKLIEMLPLFRDTERLAHNVPTDFTKGVFMHTTADVGSYLEAVLELAHEFWGDDKRWSLFIERFRSLPASGR